MKTISTLCATSTVGIAACGLALGCPRELQEEDRLSNSNSNSNSTSTSTSNTTTTSPSSSSSGRRSTSTDRFTTSPSSLSIEPPSSSASSKKAWYRRLSESLHFSSAASSSHASSSPTSTLSVSRSRHNRSFISPSPSPSPRSSTRNKLVKRPLSRAASPALWFQQSTPITGPLRQPATALARDRSLSPISTQRPTTHLESECDSDFQAYDPRPVASWRVFFTAKKHNSKSAKSIKRIYPDCLHHPTLVLAHVISDEPSDMSSVESGQSIYYDSHPSSSVMPQTPTHESPASSPTEGIKIRRRKSFTTSNILHSPRLPSRHSGNHSSAPARQYWLQHSTPYHTPSENFSPLSPPRPYTSELQPIQSSALNNNIEPEHFRIPDDNRLASESSLNSGQLESNTIDRNNTDDPAENDHIVLQTHRLSVLTNAGSEPASTLIGSDEEADRVTENGFDSLRTRVNEGVTPVRLDQLFDPVPSPPDMSSSATLKKSRGYMEEINVSPTSGVFRSLTTPPVTVDGWLSDQQEEMDDSSDWESPKNSKTLGHGNLSLVTRRSESSAAILKTSLRDNDSRSSLEDWTADWDCDSNLGGSTVTKPGSATWRVKKGKSASSKEGSNLSHSRSQSLPVRSARHMSSEIWDDDFEDELGFGTEVVVPEAIQERQQNVLRHLDAVKEFAALVEKLKKLMELAISTGSRYGNYEKTWDEAEGVIALASSGNSDKEDDTEEQPRGRQRDSEISCLSSLNDDFMDKEEDIKLFIEDENRNNTVIATARKTSILSPDNDEAGTKHKKSFERLNGRHVKSYSTSSTDSRKGSGIPRSDPVAMARSVMERVQRSSSENLYGSNPSTMSSNNEAMQFDTKMLGPLLEKVKKLLNVLENSLKDEGHFGVLSRENLVGA